MGVSLVPIHSLKPHEHIQPFHLDKIYADIAQCGYLRDPIIVSEGSHIVLDGHHRYNALKKLGVRLAPVYLC